MTKQELGSLGEKIAAEDYQKDGYALLEKNYRIRSGEIDLIFLKNGIYVFCEVKTRTSQDFAKPREWVDLSKQRKLLSAAKHYLYTHKLSDPFMRFDVVEVLIEKGRSPAINRLENAFS